LKGLHFHNRITPKNTKKAIECFEKAIELSPDYAHAYAMAATGYAYLGATGQMQPNKAFEIVHRYSDKALKLDSSLAAGYSAKGAAYLLYDWKWKQAYESLLKAVELHPATTEAHQLLSLYYLSTGRKQDAVIIMEQALEADPISPIVNQYLTDAYLNAGRTDEALKQVERLLDLYPNMRVAMEAKGWCYGLRGDWNKAVEIFEDVHRLIKHPLKGLAPLGSAYGYSGKVEKALECIHKIEQRQLEEPGTVLDIDLAMIWWSLGEKDKAFHHLFQCVEKRMGVVAILIDHPMFKGMSDDPRYQLIKEKLNLVETLRQ
jgi:tetratricopeptide (TPR) repeat protein